MCVALAIEVDILCAYIVLYKFTWAMNHLPPVQLQWKSESYDKHIDSSFTRLMRAWFSSPNLGSVCNSL